MATLKHLQVVLAATAVLGLSSSVAFATGGESASYRAFMGSYGQVSEADRKAYEEAAQEAARIRSLIKPPVLNTGIISWTRVDSTAATPPQLPDGFTVKATSTDGSVVVGYHYNSSSEKSQASLWSSDTGVVDLGILPYRRFSSARAVSSDGSVVVGASGLEAFRWTQDTGMVGLGKLPGGLSSSAYGVSEDGSSVVGVHFSFGSGGIQAFRWTQDTGMIGLGNLPDNNDSNLNFWGFGVSNDGSVVIGALEPSGTAFGEPLIWDETNGVRRLREALINDYGLETELDGWLLQNATSISGDGLTITGSGTWNGSDPLNWQIDLRNASNTSLATIPEPASLTLLMLGVIGIPHSLRRRRYTDHTK